MEYLKPAPKDHRLYTESEISNSTAILGTVAIQSIAFVRILQRSGKEIVFSFSLFTFFVVYVCAFMPEPKKVKQNSTNHVFFIYSIIFHKNNVFLTLTRKKNKKNPFVRFIDNL